MHLFSRPAGLRRCALLVLTFVLASPAWSEASGHAFGLAAGMTTGSGISYRYWPGDLGFQLTAAPVVSASSLYLNAGVTGLLRVADYPWSRFFTYLGLGGGYSSSSWFSTSSIGLGGGFGMELVLFDHFCIDLMGGYRAYYDGSFGASPTVETGIFFRL